MKGRKMHDGWWTIVFSIRRMLLLIGIFQLNSIFCVFLNHEGIALLKFKERVVYDPFGALSSWNKETTNPCSWFGIECVDEHVTSMNLKNLYLKGTLAPELHHLLHINSIILRNNSFSGIIPGEIKNLKELELLDLGYNNFCEPILHEFEHYIPILLLDSNICPELEDLKLSKINARENGHAKDGRRRVLQDERQIESHVFPAPPSPPTETRTLDNIAAAPQGLITQSPPVAQSNVIPTSPLNNSPPPPQRNNSPLPPLSNNTLPSSPPNDSLPLPPFNFVLPPEPHRAQPPTPVLPPPFPSPADDGASRRIIPTVLGVVGAFVGLVLIGLIIFLMTSKRFRKATGFSGQLKRAFVIGKDRSDGVNSNKPSFIEGIPNFKRSELLIACEDFSNVIGSSSIGTIYKGTLSNGVEIATISLAVTSAKDWSKNLETQFRKKIEVLSKVNHKNFVNIIGYCEEEEPFTRLMVFEYAPNGSLFEHLHVREAEHLDWAMRLRVAMGMAYCLEHMHDLTPPVTHPNLNSSAVNLSEDYAAKISDFCFWNEVAAPRVQPVANGMSCLSTVSLSPESNVYSFGLLLLEMMTGRIPESVENNSLDDWVLEYMRGEQPLQEMIDPMLRHFSPEQLEKINEVIRKCLHSEEHRPKMRDVTAKLREITGIVQDKAVPRFSSLWWTELDARSVNGT